MLDERIELLISRELDGELNADERMELDKAILRDPEVREVLDKSRRIDELAGVGLGVQITATTEPVELPSQPLRSHHSSSWWLPASVAAAIMVAAFLGLFTQKGGGDRLAVNPSGVSPILPDIVNQPLSPRENGPIRQVGSRDGMMNGRRDSGVFTILGEDGNLYLIQIDRVQAVQKTPTSRLVHASYGDL